MITQTKHHSVKSDGFFTRQPGWLVQKGNLILHTKVGMGYGRALLQVAKRLRTLWQASNEDNPYADRYLLQLEDAMLTVHHELDTCEQRYQHQLVQSPDIQLELVTSQNPLIMKLYFLNIYSFRIGILVGHFDRLARYALSLHALAFDNPVPLSQVLQELGAPLRKLLEIPKQWRPFKITREDIAQLNENANAAQIHFGITLDPRILSGEVRPQLIAKKNHLLPSAKEALPNEESHQEK